MNAGPISGVVGGLRPVPDPLRDAYENRSTEPVEGRTFQGSTVMYSHLHQELARQRHRDAYLLARRVRLLRASRAERRARRAVDLAVRARERVHAETAPVTT